MFNFLRLDAKKIETPAPVAAPTYTPIILEDVYFEKTQIGYWLGEPGDSKGATAHLCYPFAKLSSFDYTAGSQSYFYDDVELMRHRVHRKMYRCENKHCLCNTIEAYHYSVVHTGASKIASENCHSIEERMDLRSSLIKWRKCSYCQAELKDGCVLFHLKPDFQGCFLTCRDSACRERPRMHESNRVLYTSVIFNKFPRTV